MISGKQKPMQGKLKKGGGDSWNKKKGLLGHAPPTFSRGVVVADGDQSLAFCR